MLRRRAKLVSGLPPVPMAPMARMAHGRELLDKAQACAGPASRWWSRRGGLDLLLGLLGLAFPAHGGASAARRPFQRPLLRPYLGAGMSQCSLVQSVEFFPFPPGKRKCRGCPFSADWTVSVSGPGKKVGRRSRCWALSKRAPPAPTFRDEGYFLLEAPVSAFVPAHRRVWPAW